MYVDATLRREQRTVRWCELSVLFDIRILYNINEKISTIFLRSRYPMLNNSSDIAGCYLDFVHGQRNY